MHLFILSVFVCPLCHFIAPLAAVTLVSIFYSYVVCMYACLYVCKFLDNLVYYKRLNGLLDSSEKPMCS